MKTTNRPEGRPAGPGHQSITDDRLDDLVPALELAIRQLPAAAYDDGPMADVIHAAYELIDYTITHNLVDAAVREGLAR